MSKIPFSQVRREGLKTTGLTLIGLLGTSLLGCSEPKITQSAADAALATKVAELNTAHATDTGRLNADLTTATNQVAALTTEKQSLTANVNSLQSQLNEANAKLASTVSPEDAKALKDRVATLESELKTANEAKTEAEKQVASAAKKEPQLDDYLEEVDITYTGGPRKGQNEKRRQVKASTKEELKSLKENGFNVDHPYTWHEGRTVTAEVTAGDDIENTYAIDVWSRSGRFQWGTAEIKTLLQRGNSVELDGDYQGTAWVYPISADHQDGWTPERTCLDSRIGLENRIVAGENIAKVVTLKLQGAKDTYQLMAIDNKGNLSFIWAGKCDPRIDLMIGQQGFVPMEYLVSQGFIRDRYNNIGKS